MVLEEEERRSHSNQHHHHHGRHENQLDSDPANPDPSLVAILRGLEERVKERRENLANIRNQRADLEFKLRGLQDEKMTLDGAIAEAKMGEELVREKESQINAAFMKLSDGRRKSDSASLINKTLILGQELFSLLLRDSTIEETARKALETRVARIEIETAKKGEERHELQERFLTLQAECQAGLKQNQFVYDEIHVLQKRIESSDAQVSILTEWKKSLENQIKNVRAAVKQRQNNVPDPIALSSKDTEDNSLQKVKIVEEKILPHGDEIRLSQDNGDDVSTNDGKDGDNESILQEKSEDKLLHHDDEKPLSPNIDGSTNDGDSKSALQESHLPNRFVNRDNECVDVNAAESALKNIHSGEQHAVNAPGCTSDAIQNVKHTVKDCADNNTVGNKPNCESTSDTEDESLLTMQTSRSVLLNRSLNSESDVEINSDGDETSQSTAKTTNAKTAPFDNVLTRLHDVKNIQIPTATFSTASTKKPSEFEVGHEDFPTEISKTDLSKKVSKKDEEKEEKE
uniref:Uncharacterized protein n=1 Tax=Panagrolaimus sp. ES5 TaxID=591445 RepID=A0AC34GSA7_9BILA